MGNASDGAPASGGPVEPGESGSSPSVDRILTVPNAITVIRLSLLPVFVWLVLGREQLIGGALLLGGLGATDWVDGWVARRWHQVSTVGKVLDPVADRLLFFVSILTIIAAEAAPLWFCSAVLLRELVVAVATVLLAVLGARRIDVTWYGKAGTFALMFAFPAFMLGAADWAGSTVGMVVGWGFGLPGLALSYYAAATYVPLGVRALREGRAATGGAARRA